MFPVEKIADTNPVRPGCIPCVGGAEEASVEWLNPISKQESSSTDERQDHIMKDPMGHRQGFQFHSTKRMK